MRVVSIKQKLKIRINKPGLKLELESKNPTKHIELVHSLVETLAELNGNIKTFRRDNDLEREMFNDISSCRRIFTPELLKFKQANIIMDRMEKTCETILKRDMVAELKLSIDVKTNKTLYEIDIDSWKKAMKKRLYGLKIIKLQAVIIHVMGKKVSIDNIKSIKETALRQLNYPPNDMFVTDKDLGDKIFVELGLFGEFDGLQVDE